MKIITLLFVLLLMGTTQAQDIQEKYRRADAFRQKYGDRYFYGPIRPQWIGDEASFWYSVKTPEGKRFLLVDAAKRTKQPAFDQQAMARELMRELGRRISPDSLPFNSITFSDQMKTLTFTTDGRKFTFDRRKKKITGSEPLPPPPHSGHWARVDREDWTGVTASPDGKQEAFIREGNVYVRDRATGDVRQLSCDGSPGEYYSSRITWSPDSRRFVCCKYRPAWVRQVTTVVSSPAGRLQPTLETRDYVKPGDALPVKCPVLFVVDEGKQIPIQFAEPEAQFSVGNIRWDKDSRYFTFDYNRRGHQQYIVYKVEGDRSEARVMIDETSPTFVYYNKIYRHDFSDTEETLWISERDGWRHLYVYDRATCRPTRQLTRGEWIVKRVLHVDEAKRVVYLIGCGRDKGEDPYLEKVYRLNLDDGALTCLTPENAHHEVVFSADYKYFTDSWSRMDLPPTTALRDADGRIILPLEKADISRMLTDGWQMPEVFSAKGRDGVTDIWGVIIRPTDFDPTRKYPVIEYIYAGPHDSFVPKTFFPGSWVDGGLAELGFIVVQIDGMGTANRSKKFHDVCWKNLKDAGFPDRIAWMRAAAERHPEMDLSRVGIFGCSAGGQSAMGALLFHPEFYKVGVSACGCHDNRMDKIWWNEQWMGYPVDKSYEESSNMVNAGKLRGKLMLILGELDDNVDPSSTLQVVNALIRANKDFEFVMLPNQRHTMGEAYGERKRRDFFVRHLLGEETPDWNNINH